MTRLAFQYAADLQMFAGLPVDDFHKWLTSVPYVSDLEQCGVAECLQRPAATFKRGGDCDDKAIAAASFFILNRTPWRFVVTATRPDRLPRHVYIEFKDPAGNLIPFDSTTVTDKFAVARPHFAIWFYPMNYNYVGSDVVTFEDKGNVNLNDWAKVGDNLAAVQGKKLKDVAASALPGLALGLLGPVGIAIGAVWQLVSNLIGIKGRTVQMDEDTANAKATEMARAFEKSFYLDLPPDGRAVAVAAIDRFYTAFLSRFGSWWDGSLDKIHASHKPLWKDEEAKVFYQLHDPFFVVLRRADLGTVTENFNQWVMKEFFDPLVTLPVTRYITDQLVKVKNQGAPIPGGTNPAPVPSPVVAGLSSPLVWLGVAGVVGAILFAKKRRRK